MAYFFMMILWLGHLVLIEVPEGWVEIVELVNDAGFDDPPDRWVEQVQQGTAKLGSQGLVKTRKAEREKTKYVQTLILNASVAFSILNASVAFSILNASVAKFKLVVS